MEWDYDVAWVDPCWFCGLLHLDGAFTRSDVVARADGMTAPDRPRGVCTAHVA